MGPLGVLCSIGTLELTGAQQWMSNVAQLVNVRADLGPGLNTPSACLAVSYHWKSDKGLESAF